ncbi:MAG: phosphoribosylanthranilate isomerase [Rhodobiaceae bacterium]|jgi:phosphoribosylanthranilate isomerase|nr:phosphoribosylanthranilate isomerase [Rhodobiaceae bacterium]
MGTKIKICGLTKPEDIDVLNALNVELAGFVFYKPSPRHLTQDRGVQLASRCRPEMERVALLVDPSDDEVDMALATISPHHIQLHGNESPERVNEIRRRGACDIIKALPIETAADFAQARDYADVANWFLFDAKPSRDALPGGNGDPFDWAHLSAYDQAQAYLLAGGLNPENVGRALQISQAPMVDISSGVESAPGEKDPKRMEQFVTAVRQADTAAAHTGEPHTGKPHTGKKE